MVAYSNGINRSLEISSSSKRELQRIFRGAAKPHMFVYKTFSCLIYLLIRSNLELIEEVVIDQEYVGQESLVRKCIVELIRKGGQKGNPDFISFARIGRKNNAHTKSIKTYRRILQPDVVVGHEDLLKWLF